MIELPEQQPRPVAKAAQVVVEREADVAAAKEGIAAAHAAIKAAIEQDRAAYADALDRGEDDPGPEAEENARRELAECERRFAVEEVRLTRAREAFEATCHDAIGGWQETLTRALEKAESEALEAVDALEAAELKRARLRADLFWLERYAERGQLTGLGGAAPAMSPIVINQQAGPRTHDVLTLLGGIRDGIEAATLGAAAARAAEREQAERELAASGRPYLHVAER
jgi:hypothetical protein